MPAPFFVLSPSGECLLACGAGGAASVKEQLQRITAIGQLAANMVPIGSSDQFNDYIEMPLPASREQMCLLLVEMEGFRLMAGTMINDQQAGRTTHKMVPVNSQTQLAEGMCRLTLSDRSNCTCSGACRRALLKGLFVRCIGRLSGRGCTEVERTMVLNITGRKEPMVSSLSLLLAAIRVDEKARDPSLFSGKDVLASAKLELDTTSKGYADMLEGFTRLAALPMREVRVLLAGIVESLMQSAPTIEAITPTDEAVIRLSARTWAAHATVNPDEVLTDGGVSVIRRLRALM